MHPRAAELIATLRLRPHPEGGHFAEVFRSAARVRPSDSRAERAALTTIYFLLTAADVSCWHRVRSDEAWHFYEGDPLELMTADPGFAQISRRLLGGTTDATSPVHVVGADEWQAARSTGDYTLVGCTVGPGFEFQDFEMLRGSAGAETVRKRHPEFADFI